jgi:hypothetical protein
MYLIYLLIFVIISLIVCQLADHKVISEHSFTSFLILLTMILAFLFIISIVKMFKILKVKEKKLNISIIIELFLIVNLLFAHIYFLLYLINRNNYSGIDNIKYYTYTHEYIYFFYFSNSVYFTIGFGDIYPITILPRMMSVLQMICAYIFTIYYFTKIVGIIKN